jgi:hypothetical protein
MPLAPEAARRCRPSPCTVRARRGRAPPCSPRAPVPRPRGHSARPPLASAVAMRPLGEDLARERSAAHRQRRPERPRRGGRAPARSAPPPRGERSPVAGRGPRRSRGWRGTARFHAAPGPAGARRAVARRARPAPGLPGRGRLPGAKCRFISARSALPFVSRSSPMRIRPGVTLGVTGPSGTRRYSPGHGRRENPHGKDSAALNDTRRAQLTPQPPGASGFEPRLRHRLGQALLGLRPAAL